MATNIGFDSGHPYVEEGADAGMLVDDGQRIWVMDAAPPASVAVELERSIDGNVWEPVIETESGAALVDWESWSYGNIHYRGTAFTAEGAASVTEIIVKARSGALWLSGGPGFGVTCRLPLNPSIGFAGGRATSQKMYAGRTRPVIDKGKALSDVYSIGGTVTDRNREGDPEAETTSPDQLRDLVQLPDDLHMLRTPDGKRIYGAVSGVNLSRDMTTTDDDPLRPWNAFWGYGFELTEGTGV